MIEHRATHVTATARSPRRAERAGRVVRRCAARRAVASASITDETVEAVAARAASLTASASAAWSEYVDADRAAVLAAAVPVAVTTATASAASLAASASAYWFDHLDSDPAAGFAAAVAVAAAAWVPAEAARALGLGGDVAAAARGMDEWAALAAAEGDEEPEVLRKYDPPAHLQYFLGRPLVLARRFVTSSAVLGKFAGDIYIDAKTGRRPEDDPATRDATDDKRAEQLFQALVRLGPTYVKLGQVLASRQDLLPAPYVARLLKLQDSVPPFDDGAARRIVARELGAEVSSGLRLSAAPLACASLGQVYKASSSDGEVMAVKVQRPGALAAVCLDVAIIRTVGPTLYKLNEPDGNLDALALIDEWGTRFVDELDYRLERRNGEDFLEAMSCRRDALGSAVRAPRPVGELCSRRVLTTEWVEGVRIDRVADPAERGRACAVALSAYLAMLLETGTLHVDPHPGNLLVADSDGALVILDWGLVTTVAPRQQAAILTFVAHLVSEDYAKVDADLLAMGFVPPEKARALQDAGLSRSIASLFSALAAGGGASGFRRELGLPDEDELKELRKKIVKIKDKEKRKQAFIEAAGGTNSKVAKLSKDLEGVQAKYGNVFTIPSYFFYILRAFSVLEGIGLAADPEYSIANECYPFVAALLLSGGDTAAGGATRDALAQLLYGPGGPEAGLDSERVRDLASSFASYSDAIGPAASRARVGATEAAAVTAGSGATDEVPPAVKAALRLALDPRGGPLQEVAVRELSRGFAAVAAGGAWAPALAAAAESALAADRAAAAATQAGAGGGVQNSFGGISLVPPTPLSFFDEYVSPALTSTAAQVDPSDAAVVELVGEMVRAATTAAEAGTHGAALPAVLPAPPSQALVRDAAELAAELAPGAGIVAARLAAGLLREGAARTARR